MSELIDLTKKVEVVLDLRKISNTVKAQVCLAIDGSGSMTNLYSNGTVQKTVDRISAVAVKFDDNQELDVLVFSNGVNEAKSATPLMFGSYVKKELLDKRLVQFAGTEFVPMVSKVVENYFSKNQSVNVSDSIIGTIKNIFGFGSKPTQAPVVSSSKSNSGFPIFCIIITDGENSDTQETRRILTSMQDKDVYWQIVGIGNERFTFCKQIADELPNVGFFTIPNLDTIKDLELYKSLITEEFATFIKKF